MTADARSEIQRLIADNRGTIGPDLIRFFSRACQDLCAGGLDPDAVLDSAFTAAVVLKIARSGVDETITFLRAVADLHEASQSNPPFPEESRH